MLPTVPQRRSATALRRVSEGEGTQTIVVALVANLVIALAKLFGGLHIGSTAMLAEAAHSAADSVNEIFLAVGLSRDRRPADEAHPFGHGRERFLWAFMAAIASFLIGGCLSIAMAISQFKQREPISAGITPWIILAVAFAADGASWVQSMRQARHQASEYGLPVWSYIRRASDPIVRAVVFEDSAALIGLFLAATGLLASSVVRTSLPDSVASLAIGVLLAITAFALAHPFADFLIGRSIPQPQLETLHNIVRNNSAVEQIVSLRALYSGPEEVVVMTKIHPSARLNVQQLAEAMDGLDHTIRTTLPFVADVFIDVTANRTNSEPSTQ